jgi:hypothetical protein
MPSAFLTPLNQQLLHAVAGLLVGEGAARQKRHPSCKALAVELGEVAHLGGVGDAPFVDPLEDLLGPEGGHESPTLLFAPGGQGLWGVIKDVVSRIAQPAMIHRPT